MSEQHYSEGEGEEEFFDRSDASDNAGESHLEPQFLAKRKKAKQVENQKKKSSTQQAKKILNAATASRLPHSSSAESRSVIEFVKFMMGCPSRKFELLPEPTVEEVEAWENWVPDREEMINRHLESYLARKQPQSQAEKEFLISQELQKIKKAPIFTVYSPAPTVKNRDFSQTVKNTCDHEFISNGFPRITFEWTNSLLANSKWNTATAAVIERWLPTAKKRLRRNVQDAPVAADSHNSTSAIKARHNIARKKVAEHRFETALVLFPQNPEVWSCFQATDTVSDYEESEDIRIPPTRIIPAWRSTVFSDLAHELDRATVQLAPRKLKASVAARLARRGERNPTKEEEESESPPERLPVDAYNRAFLKELSEIEQEQMGIHDQTGEENLYSLAAALANLQRRTAPVSSRMVE
ncbi:hypothetical protein PCANC_10734 [Puccinia coronata f. sp. avenae]|uniref:Uncharacterized protein n=1 Tax=Puccinia coronata f. sp. avenae TaxID=200324 RepID=A0A2N5VSP9_9BASI|nr:hypothetical protein PCANC_10734 [Puccinia coronata f. sp. avenae]